MDAIQPAWKIISLILGLGVFIGVGAMAMSMGDELLWGVGKAVVGFIASWIVLNYLGALLGAVADRPVVESGIDTDSEAANERG